MEGVLARELCPTTRRYRTGGYLGIARAAPVRFLHSQFHSLIRPAGQSQPRRNRVGLVRLEESLKLLCDAHPRSSAVCHQGSVVTRMDLTVLGRDRRRAETEPPRGVAR